MPDLPVMLNIAGKRCVIVGGGSVALRRAQALLECGGKVTVIAPQVDPGIEEQSKGQREGKWVTWAPRKYWPGDLKGAYLVVIATDDPKVNEEAAREAQEVGALVNRADWPEKGDVTIPAHSRHGCVTLAVHTGGASARAAAAIRNELSAALDPDWPALLEIAKPFRALIQKQVSDADERLMRLGRLTDGQAIRLFKKEGAEGYTRYCGEILRGEFS